jgi:predicted dehydrogenase
MKRKISFAMVGGGRGSFIGPIHRMAAKMDDSAILVAGCFSRDKKENLKTAEETGLKSDRLYSSWQSLIEKEKGNIDFLTVCTPNDSHYEITKAALESGMHVLCEKPLSLTRKEAEKIEKLAAKKNLLVAVPFTYTGFPMVKLARELVSGGELGKICKVNIEYVQGSFRKINFKKPLDKRNAWKMDPSKSGPSCVVADIGVHGACLIEYITGLEIKSVLSDISSFAPGNTLDDDASILMRLDEGAKAAMVTSKVATGEENGVRVRVYGDKASLFWNQELPNQLSVKYPNEPERIYKRNTPYIGAVSPMAAAASRIPSGHDEGFIEAFANIYRGFCAAVAGENKLDFPTAYEGVRTMRFVEAVLKSAGSGSRWMQV